MTQSPSAGRPTERGRVLPRVVVVGAGFGGLWAATGLGGASVEVVLIDRNNYHTFMPLLYQVAAAEIGEDQPVTPIRKILRKFPNLRFHLAEVTGIDLDRRTVKHEDGELEYDYLVLAAGARPHFFGVPGADDHAFPLRSLEHAVDIRNHILRRWEEASRERDKERQRALLTVAIVGAGPTGVEFAGAVRELFRVPLSHDFPEVEGQDSRIVLLEATDRALPDMPAVLGNYAVQRLRRMGVDVRLNSAVNEVRPDCVFLSDGTQVAASTIVWTAGVSGQPLAEGAGVSYTRQQRISVEPTLQIPGYPETYIVGDLASVTPLRGPPVPMIAPAAMQLGTHAATNIKRSIEGKSALPFVYRDRGMLAVIGRNAAACRVYRWNVTGFPAWLLWAGVHLYELIGFRNRIVVLVNWAWDYLFFERAARMIVPSRRVRLSRLDRARRTARSSRRNAE